MYRVSDGGSFSLALNANMPRSGTVGTTLKCGRRNSMVDLDPISSNRVSLFSRIVHGRVCDSESGKSVGYGSKIKPDGFVFYNRKKSWRVKPQGKIGESF